MKGTLQALAMAGVLLGPSLAWATPSTAADATAQRILCTAQATMPLAPPLASCTAEREGGGDAAAMPLLRPFVELAHGVERALQAGVVTQLAHAAL